MTKEKEAFIIINKHELNEGQSLTIRIALEVFLQYILDTGLGDDEEGVRMTEAYITSINSIRRIIFRSMDIE
jgi:hypothetical protein